MAIRLPQNPDGHQYEDMVASWLQALGYFTETRIKLREGTSELLELDVVASRSDVYDQRRILVEAKKGTAKFSDIFKVYGWRSYLEIDEGCLVHKDAVEEYKVNSLHKLSQEIKVHTEHLDVTDLSPTSCLMMLNNLEKGTFTDIVGAAWYKQLAIRESYANFITKCKSHPDVELFRMATNYDRDIQASFFNKDVASRIFNLYSAYQTCPRITGDLISFIQTNQNPNQRNIWDEVYNTRNYLWLQYLMLIEHRARLHVMKNALDYLIEKEQYESKHEDQGIDWGSELELLLPENFKKGMKKLINLEYAPRVPYFLQIFIEIFGGFYLPHSKDEELLEKISGIKKSNIPEALETYNDFFPFRKSWFYDFGDLKLLKMVPAFIRGSGCFARTITYKLKSYRDYSILAHSVLKKWHSAIYKTLEPILGYDEIDEREH